MSDDLDEIVDNLREPTSWIRVLFMLGFVAVLYLVIAPIVLVLSVVQALFSLLTGESNYNLRRFGKAIAEYVQQILHYLSFNSHDKPFPFADFPALDDEEEPQATRPASRSSSTARSESSAEAKENAEPSVEKPGNKSSDKTAKKTPAKKKSASKKTAKPAAAKKSETDEKPAPDAPESD